MPENADFFDFTENIDSLKCSVFDSFLISGFSGSKNALKCIKRQFGGDIGEMAVYAKGMGVNIRAYGGRILLSFQSFGI